jgi:hypothetical protein
MNRILFFLRWFQDASKKTGFFEVFLLILMVATLTPVFKNNKLFEDTTVKIKVFINLLLVDGRIQVRIGSNNYGSPNTTTNNTSRTAGGQHFLMGLHCG